MSLIFIRHGETEWNRQGRIQGWLDSRLTNAAICQTQQLSLPKLNSPIIYSSDLGRAVETAQILARRLTTKVVIDKRLRERCFGLLQGKVVDQGGDLEPYWQAYHQRYQVKLTSIPEVESESALEQRARLFLQSIQVQSEHQDCLIVSHGEWIRAAVNLLNGRKSWHEGCGVGANLCLSLSPSIANN